MTTVYFERILVGKTKKISAIFTFTLTSLWGPSDHWHLMRLTKTWIFWPFWSFLRSATINWSKFKVFGSLSWSFSKIYFSIKKRKIGGVSSPPIPMELTNLKFLATSQPLDPFFPESTFSHFSAKCGWQVDWGWLFPPIYIPFFSRAAKFGF